MPFRRQAAALDEAHQTLHGRFTANLSPSSRIRAIPDDTDLTTRIREIKARKPTWGVRRVRAWVRKKAGIPVGRKRVSRIMRREGLLCPRIKKREHRNIRTRITATRINQLWATDMTSFVLSNGSTVYLVLVEDVFTRRIVGWHVSSRCRAVEWTTALDQAILTEFPDGSRGQNLTLRMDNGCQPTSKHYQEVLSVGDITGEWTGYNCPEQNAHIESLIGTLKADWLWLDECSTLEEARALCARAVSEYNAEHPHSALGMWTPLEFTDLVKKGLVSVNNNSLVFALKAA